MTTSIPYLIQGDNVVLVLDNKSHTISRKTHIVFDKVTDAIKAQDWDAVRDLINPKQAIINYGKGDIEIKDNVIYWKGKEFHNALASKMITMFKEGYPIEPMVNFMANLMNNPSHRSVTQLYGFLEKGQLPITEDGHFLAFKKVRKDFFDIHSGTFDNSVGQICQVDRNSVDDNPTNTCSSGLHFCAQSYLPHFGSSGDPVMILKINPADVVSIPTDYNDAKGRCCKYEVVGQVGVTQNPETIFDKPVNDDYDADAEDDELDEDDELSDVASAVDPLRPATYDVYRVNGGAIEYTDLTYDMAKYYIEKNVRQKQAQLMMRPHQ